ncbi:hypothetical protein FACS1894132_14620 [Clostridia bacterium]|nr:hypothetical protein FACS1894132_14620 [Clostridia bacterium]
MKIYNNLTVEDIQKMRYESYLNHKDELDNGNSQPFLDEIREGAKKVIAELSAIKNKDGAIVAYGDS